MTLYAGPITKSVILYFQEGYAAPEAKSCATSVKLRVLLLVKIPLEILAVIADTLCGLLYTVGTVCTLGLYKKWAIKACDYFSSLAHLLSQIFINILYLVNLDPVGCPNQKKTAWKAHYGYANITAFVCVPLIQAFDYCIGQKESLFFSQIASRGVQLLRLPVQGIAAVIDLALGSIALVFSIILRGKVSSLNNAAYHGFQAPGILIQEGMEVIATLRNPYMMTA